MIKKRFGIKGGLSTMTFGERVVLIALSIPKGKVTTYGRIARVAGGGNMASRSVTSILGKAYSQGQKDIPFHRIVYSDGRVWMSESHEKERMRKYKEEGILLDSKGRVIDFENVLYDIPKNKNREEVNFTE